MLHWRIDGIPPRLFGGPFSRFGRRRWFRESYHPSPEALKDITVKARNRCALSRFWTRWDRAGRKQQWP